MIQTRSSGTLSIADNDELEQRLKTMHQAMVEIWPHHHNSPPVPSIDSCLLAHRYQESWAPSIEGVKDINLLVLGESHLWTDSSILGVDIDQTMHPHVQLPQLGHLNLVHCPSYGELELLPESIRRHMSPSCSKTVNTGTWQFWRVLMVLAGLTDYDPSKGELDVLVDTPLKDVYAPLHKLKYSLQKRLELKAEIRRCLRKRRIMFADVSPAPIAVGGSNSIKVLNKTTGKPYTTKRIALNDSDKNAIIRVAWNEYSSHLVRKYKPRYVLILGRTVLSAIGVTSFHQVLENHGGVLLGALYHPSCNHTKLEASARVMMRYLRHVALEASRSPCLPPQFPNIEQVSKHILEIFNETSNKRSRGKKMERLELSKKSRPIAE